MRINCRSWLVALFVILVMVVWGMQTSPSELRAQSRPATSPKFIWSRVRAPGGPAGPLYVYRAPVPGGWLVMVHQERERGARNGEGYGYGMGVGNGVTFLPDPDHAWKPSS